MSLHSWKLLLASQLYLGAAEHLVSIRKKRKKGEKRKKVNDWVFGGVKRKIVLSKKNGTKDMRSRAEREEK